MRKPHIPVTMVPWLLEIDTYIRRFNLRGQQLAHVASDVLDGAALRHELEPLVRRRLLTVIPVEDGLWSRDETTMCGRTFTVHLTERAMKALWPQRMKHA